MLAVDRLDQIAETEGGMYWIRRPDAEAPQLCSELASLALGQVRHLRGYKCRTTWGLFREWDRAFGMPNYFGGNWDAFDEVLSDRAFEVVGPLVIVFSHLDRVLRWACLGTRRIFAHILDCNVDPDWYRECVELQDDETYIPVWLILVSNKPPLEAMRL